jgi:hypothetical protein
MNNRTLLALVVVFIFVRTAFSADDLSAMPLKDAFKGAGSLVIVKGETISGLNPDGTPAFQQEVTYYGADESLTPNPKLYAKTANQLTCTAMVETTDSNHGAGGDVTLSVGQSIAWDNNAPYENIMDEPFVANGVTYQGMRLTFFGSGSKLSVMYCTIAGPQANKTLTIKDFEEATGGRMTLRPQN